MGKTLLVIGLILLLAGGSMLWWVIDEMYKPENAETGGLGEGSQTQDFLSKYDQWMQLPEQERIQAIIGVDANGVPKTNSQILIEQQKRLKADIDKLASGDSGVESYADVLYGSNWRQEVDNYKRRQEQTEILFTCAVVCTSLGGVITTLLLLFWLVRLLFKGSKKQADSRPEISARSSSTAGNSGAAKSNFHNDNGFRSIGTKNKGEDFTGIMDHPGGPTPDTKAGEGGLVKTLLNKEVAITSQTVIAESGKGKNSRKRLKCSASQKVEQAGLAPSKEQIDKETPERKTVKSTPKEEKNKPLDHTLMELTQQVSAIREYAANQQNRLKRFQDGYDWNIIKNFCLRIIRCIDNIEGRIDDLAERQEDTSELEQIRDELVFALESSGVERFEPELNSEYRGQEKYAEALKDKCCSGDSEKKGKIERVVKPGYQCYIDEQNIRVVRPAQVRLYA